jgi:hypothetical protein
MDNVIAFPACAKAPTGPVPAEGCATPAVSGGNVIDLEAVRAEEANWLYGRWDIRQLPLDIEDWPQALLELMAAEWQSKDPFGDMLAEHDAARRALFHVVK